MVTCHSRSRRIQTCRKCSHSHTANRACSEGNRGPGTRRGQGESRGAPAIPGPATETVSLSSEGLCSLGLDGTPDSSLLTRKGPQPGIWPILSFDQRGDSHSDKEGRNPGFAPPQLCDSGLVTSPL